MKVVTAVGAVPSRLLGVVRVVASEKKGLPPDVLLARMSPPALRDGSGDPPTGIRDSIDALRELGILRDLGTTRASQRLVATVDSRVDTDSLRDLLGGRLTQPKLGSKKNRFAFLVAWLLQISWDEVPRDHQGFKDLLKRSGLALAEEMRNDARWENLFYWTNFLGLTWEYKQSKCEGVVPDPTTFLRRHLSQCLPVAEQTTVADFKNRLGEICPVLDGGEVHRSLIHELNRPAVDDRLSWSLSFALQRLEQEGRLKMWCPDDQRPGGFVLLSGARAQGRKVAFLKTLESDAKAPRRK